MNDGRAVAIEAINVSRVFGSGEDRVVALDNVSVRILENEFFTLLGPSGCGKTTLLRLVAGFDHPTSGEIRLYGEDISALPPYRRPINTVFQNYALFPHLSVARNIAFGLENLGKPKAEVSETVDEMLRLVKMEPMRNRLTSEISGGQQQRVALARALAPHPRVLLLDEPLSALDFKLRKEMQLELKRLQHETGITFIFVTHDQEEALTMSDNIAVVNQGTIRQVGTPSQIYDAPAERFVADFIGDTNILTGKAVSGENGRILVDLSCGGRISAVSGADAPVVDSADVYLAVRPEHASLVGADDAPDITGELENMIYFGTDTHYHIKLDNDDRFTVRLQNRPDIEHGFGLGERVGVKLARNAVRVLQG